METNIDKVAEILDSIITVASLPNETVDGFTYPMIEVTGISVDEFYTLYLALNQWLSEQSETAQQPNPSSVLSIFVLEENGSYRLANTSELIEALVKVKVLKERFGNKYGMGSRYKMDDPHKPAEIVKYESDWMDL